MLGKGYATESLCVRGQGDKTVKTWHRIPGIRLKMKLA